MTYIWKKMEVIKRTYILDGWSSTIKRVTRCCIWKHTHQASANVRTVVQYS
jgi:hypothetical protein